MVDMTKVLKEYTTDMTSVNSYCDDLYEQYFSQHFADVRDMYSRMKSNIRPITDEELEYILTLLPMEMFAVSEALNKLRLQCEVVKLKNKETLEQFRKTCIEKAQEHNLNKTETTEYINHSVSEYMIEYEVFLAAHTACISRVENEQTFAKELIMGAKKIWDSRRNAETSNPVKEVVPDLPEYDATANKTYIK